VGKVAAVRRFVLLSILSIWLLPVAAHSQAPTLLATWNINPPGLAHPVGIAVAPDGNVYVANRAARNLMAFTSGGGLTTTWGTYGRDPASITGPQGIAVDATGHVFVAEEVTLDFSQSHFQVFTTAGTYLTSWGTAGGGTAPGDFYGPFGVALGPGNRVYVTDPDLGRTQVFSTDGTFIMQWPTQAYGIAIDAAGSVFVTENAGVRKYTSTGTELTHWGTLGTGPGEFNSPAGIAVDAAGKVYVADTKNCRVQVFTNDGTFITQWGTAGYDMNQFDAPQGIAIDASGLIYVADSYNNQVKVFGSLATPTKSTSWGHLKATYR
jgi:DNA-binding beta-propeller fold protein YncE